MQSRKTARKWGSVAIGLALWGAGQHPLFAQENLPKFSAVRDSAPKSADATRDMMRKSRTALQAGDFAAAETLAKQAQATGAPLPYWESDTPERLLADITNARAKAAPNADPKALLKQARESLAAGKFDEAQALASRATAIKTSWGLFDDTPSKCLDDLQKARAKAEKAEAGRLMADARKCLDQGKFDEAEGMAYRAEKLNGSFNIWEGDRPSKLLAEVQAARAKKKAGVAVVRGDADKAPAPVWPEDKNPKSEILRVSGTTTLNPIREQAKLLMAEGKSAMRGGKFSDARLKFVEAQRLNVEFRADEDNPARCMNDLMAAVTKHVRDTYSMACDQANPDMCQDRLLAAKKLATEFSLDIAAPEARFVDAKEPAAMESVNLGKQLNDKARIEVQHGRLDSARELAMEAHNGPYNVRAEAAEILRAIDIEAAKATMIPVSASAPAMTEAPAPTAVPVMLPPPVVAPAAPVAPAPAAPAPLATPVSSNMIPSQLPQDTLAGQMKALQKVEYQRLREEGQKAQTEAKSLFERGETDVALDILQQYLAKVKNSQLDPAEITLLQRPVENRLQTLKVLKVQKDSETKITTRKSKHDSEKSRVALADERKREQIRDLMKQYNQLSKEGKHAEAKLAAAKAYALDPEDPSLQAVSTIATAKLNLNDYDSRKQTNEQNFTRHMTEVLNSGPNVGDTNPLYVDPKMAANALNRGKGVDGVNLKNRTEAEREIQHRLSMPVDLNFQNTPLRQVIDDLRTLTGINIVTEVTALEEEHVNLDQPVTMKVERLNLEKALKNLLAQVHLTSVIADDVLKITTEKRARGQMVQKVYRVADLVMAVDDYCQSDALNLEKSLNRVIDQQKLNLRNGATPNNNGRFMLPDGTPASQGSSPTLTTTPSNNGGQLGASPIGATTMTKQTIHETVIKLIQNTIAPQSWAEVGGSGTIEYMPFGMALIINQTPDVQEQVEELLGALRRLQDLQVAVEIKLITLSETFFERIGLDFNLNVKTDRSTSRFEPQLTSGQFKPAGQVNDFSPNKMIAGVTPAGSFTSDLDIPIRSSSFGYSIPPFAFPNNPGFDGGLSMGLAFLSDIQVFMFMEAAQGDRRIHVMQAPKLTMFNGQTSNLSVQDQQFFVTNVGVVGFGGQIVFAPQNNPFPLGVEMTLQAVVSADRRFVRLNINQRMSNLASANVPLFPVTTFITPVFEGGAQGQPIPFTQFIQQPQLSLISIQTTVSVPDGGTVILGGLKTLSEGRNEFGPPVLSKLPYVNRLFRNTGFGREAQSLLMMVTPRVIINSEEELKQTGVNSNPE